MEWQYTIGVQFRCFRAGGGLEQLPRAQSKKKSPKQRWFRSKNTTILDAVVQLQRGSVNPITINAEASSDVFASVDSLL